MNPFNDLANTASKKMPFLKSFVEAGNVSIITVKCKMFDHVSVCYTNHRLNWYKLVKKTWIFILSFWQRCSFEIYSSHQYRHVSAPCKAWKISPWEEYQFWASHQICQLFPLNTAAQMPKSRTALSVWFCLCMQQPYKNWTGSSKNLLRECNWHFYLSDMPVAQKFGQGHRKWN